MMVLLLLLVFFLLLLLFYQNYLITVQKGQKCHPAVYSVFIYCFEVQNISLNNGLAMTVVYSRLVASFLQGPIVENQRWRWWTRRKICKYMIGLRKNVAALDEKKSDKLFKSYSHFFLFGATLLMLPGRFEPPGPGRNPAGKKYRNSVISTSLQRQGSRL